MNHFAFLLYSALPMLNPYISVTQADMATDYMANLNQGPEPEYKSSNYSTCCSSWLTTALHFSHDV